jgi:hypothetical protein
MDWAYGIPVDIMQKITDIFKENLDGKSFTSFSRVNKHWTRACERDALKNFNINLDKVSYNEVISVGVIWRNIEVLYITCDVDDELYDYYDVYFAKIARYFPKLRQLHISGKVNLLLPSLEIISSIDTIERIYMEVSKFSAKGVMMMGNLPNMDFMYACSKSTGCKFTVDPSSEKNRLLSKNFIDNRNSSECVEFVGFEPVPGDEVMSD